MKLGRVKAARFLFDLDLREEGMASSMVAGRSWKRTRAVDANAESGLALSFLLGVLDGVGRTPKEPLELVTNGSESVSEPRNGSSLGSLGALFLAMGRV